MSDNLRRPGGINVNGIPTADEIIALGTHNFFVASALQCWKEGRINFDEALRLAVFDLIECNKSLNSIMQDMAARAWPGPIVVEHPRSE